MDQLQDIPAVPQYFYRVFDEDSCAQFHEISGFVASIPNAIYDPKHWNARGELERHMDWTNIHPTPFISVTASREKALEFALQRVGKQRRAVTIAKIDSSRLKAANVNVYRMCTLVEQTGAGIKREAMNEHEYLCVRCIPANAVIRLLTLGDERQ
ncbi:hypothetical protein EV702DRAFT_1140610 [Suillus placidus]|uniref:DUF7587 domain-containing protein n=1 Tax=Suillus placidus TaxID=48579 RepID=A0A9P6ZL72_9AGAM|nr:hypothetical protein EV702DRAFT_1140610 [Suillus placidus]